MRYIIALLSLMLLASCGLFPKNVDNLACPEIGFVNNSDSISIDNSKISMHGFSGSCSFSEGEGVVVDIVIPFAVDELSSKLLSRTSQLELPYFIAVLKPDETILRKTVFTAYLDLNEIEGPVGSEEHRIVIPLTSMEEGYNYKVTLGFILNN